MRLALLIAQQIPPIHVTVQQPAGNLPEWLKILITAGTGALLGIISNIAMEYVKPSIGKRLLKKTVAQQLSAELIKNLSAAEAGQRVLHSAEKKPKEDREYALTVGRLIVSGIKTDRFDLHFAENKSIVYELDANQSLETFYQLTRHLLTKPAEDQHYESTNQLFFMAATLGQAYLQSHRLKFVAVPNQLELAYQKVLAAHAAEEKERPEDYIY